MIFIIVPVMLAAGYYIVTVRDRRIQSVRKFQASRDLEAVQIDHAKALHDKEEAEVEIDLRNRRNTCKGTDYYFFKEGEIEV